MTSPFPTCPICKHPHSRGSSHVWDDETEVFAPQKAVETSSLAKASIKLGNEIRRDIPSRSVAGSAPDPVTVGIINRDDETTARQGEVPHMSAQSSQPPQRFDDRVRGIYQRHYMRHAPRAKAEGMTVKQYWDKIGFDWRTADETDV